MQIKTPTNTETDGTLTNTECRTTRKRLLGTSNKNVQNASSHHYETRFQMQISKHVFQCGSIKYVQKFDTWLIWQFGEKKLGEGLSHATVAHFLLMMNVDCQTTQTAWTCCTCCTCRTCPTCHTLRVVVVVVVVVVVAAANAKEASTVGVVLLTTSLDALFEANLFRLVQ